MAADVLASYSYSYGGSESDFNRIINFKNKDGSPASLKAKVMTLSAQPVKIASVPAHKISVELQSTTEKAQALMLAYSQVGVAHVLQVKTMDCMEIHEQNSILSKVRPSFHKGSGYRIEITNDVGGPNGLETVVKLNLFDPS